MLAPVARLALSVAVTGVLAACQELPTAPAVGISPDPVAAVGDAPTAEAAADRSRNPALQRLLAESLRLVEEAEGAGAVGDLIAPLQAIRAEARHTAVTGDPSRRVQLGQAVRLEMARLVLGVQGAEPVERLLTAIGEQSRQLLHLPEAAGGGRRGFAVRGRVGDLAAMQREARHALDSGDPLTALRIATQAADILQWATRVPGRGELGRPSERAGQWFERSPARTGNGSFRFEGFRAAPRRARLEPGARFQSRGELSTHRERLRPAAERARLAPGMR
jgi:hypothetical protein